MKKITGLDKGSTIYSTISGSCTVLGFVEVLLSSCSPFQILTSFINYISPFIHMSFSLSISQYVSLTLFIHVSLTLNSSISLSSLICLSHSPFIIFTLTLNSSISLFLSPFIHMSLSLSIHQYVSLTLHSSICLPPLVIAGYMGCINNSPQTIVYSAILQ